MKSKLRGERSVNGLNALKQGKKGLKISDSLDAHSISNIYADVKCKSSPIFGPFMHTRCVIMTSSWDKMADGAERL